MSESFQRNQAEKELILLEIQMLKQQAKASGNLAFMGQEEKDHWDKLVDSNIRAGTMACMWCMKAQLVKKTSLAFHKWKFAVAELTWKRSASPGRLNNSSNGKGTVDKHKIHTNGPMSAVLANAINLVHHLKETEVESSLNMKLFMSPSASVNAANAAATSVLQFDTNQLGLPPAAQSAEALEAYNKQRLAYVLRSLHENNQQGDASHHSLNLDGSRRGDAPGINLSTEEGLDAYLRSALLSNDADSETKRQILLALSHTVTAKQPHNGLPMRDPQVANRSSLSLLKGVAASNPIRDSSEVPIQARGRTNSRSLSPNARMHSRPRVLNNLSSPDVEDVHFFSASDVEPESTSSSRGASLHLDGRPHSVPHRESHRDSHSNGGYHATDYNPSRDSSFTGGFPTRTYPPVAQTHHSTLRSDNSSAGNSTNRRSQPQQVVPRYLLPTNSYRKKRNSLPESARPGGSNKGRSRSPTMITNSNSKHAVNVLGARNGSHSPPVAYTVKEAIARSRSTTPNGQRPSAQQTPLSYGDLSFADYQQRKSGGLGPRGTNHHTPYATGDPQTGQQQQGSPKATAGSFLDSVTQGIANYYASPPHPAPNGGTNRPHMSRGMPGGPQSQHLPLPAVPLSLPDASYFMQPPPAPEQVYQQYDAYHSNTLRTNSADIYDTQHGGGHGVHNSYNQAFAGSGDVLMDEDVILHSGFEHAPVRGDVYHTQMPVLPYVANQQQSQPMQYHENSAAYAPTAPSARQKQRNNQAVKEKPKGMDKAQMELMMHGDVYDRPASWHKSLRSK